MFNLLLSPIPPTETVARFIVDPGPPAYVDPAWLVFTGTITLMAVVIPFAFVLFFSRRS